MSAYDPAFQRIYDRARSFGHSHNESIRLASRVASLAGDLPGINGRGGLYHRRGHEGYPGGGPFAGPTMVDDPDLDDYPDFAFHREYPQDYFQTPRTRTYASTAWNLGDDPEDPYDMPAGNPFMGRGRATEGLFGMGGPRVRTARPGMAFGREQFGESIPHGRHRGSERGEHSSHHHRARASDRGERSHHHRGHKRGEFTTRNGRFEFRRTRSDQPIFDEGFEEPLPRGRGFGGHAGGRHGRSHSFGGYGQEPPLYGERRQDQGFGGIPGFGARRPSFGGFGGAGAFPDAENPFGRRGARPSFFENTSYPRGFGAGGAGGGFGAGPQFGGREPEGPSPYDILGVSPYASQDDIKKAYRKMSLKHHPDRAPAGKKEEATAMMAKINEAYEMLRD